MRRTMSRNGLILLSIVWALSSHVDDLIAAWCAIDLIGLRAAASLVIRDPFGAHFGAGLCIEVMRRRCVWTCCLVGMICWPL